MRTLILAALLVAAPLAGRSAADVATASYLDDAMNTYTVGGPCSAYDTKCQTFTAGQAGQLVSVGLRMFADASLPGLNVSVYAVDSDTLPTGVPLCSEDFSTASAPTAMPAALITFAFSGPTPILQAGTMYAIVARSADTGSSAHFTLNGFYGILATYDGGTFMQDGCTNPVWSPLPVDLGFEVIVNEAVPDERSSWGGVKALYR